MQVVTYRGEIEELRGTSWEIPETVPLNGRKAWIESHHREQKAREAAANARAKADAEAQAREAELLASRVEAAKSGEAFRSDLNDLRERIDGMQEQLDSPTPEAEGLVTMHTSVIAAFTTAKQVLEQVEEAVARADELTSKANALLSDAEDQKQASITLLRNQQDMVNGSFETYRRALATLQEETNQASRSVGALNTAAQDNRELIATAANISEEAVNIAGLEAKKAVEEGMTEMLAVLSLALEAMGIDEKSLALQLNTDSVDPNRGIFLTREYLRRVKDIYAAKGNARDADIDGPLL